MAVESRTEGLTEGRQRTDVHPPARPRRQLPLQTPIPGGKPMVASGSPGTHLLQSWWGWSRKAILKLYYPTTSSDLKRIFSHSLPLLLVLDSLLLLLHSEDTPPPPKRFSLSLSLSIHMFFIRLPGIGVQRARQHRNKSDSSWQGRGLGPYSPQGACLIYTANMGAWSEAGRVNRSMLLGRFHLFCSFFLSFLLSLF